MPSSQLAKKLKDGFSTGCPHLNAEDARLELCDTYVCASRDQALAYVDSYSQDGRDLQKAFLISFKPETSALDLYSKFLGLR